MQHPAAAGFTTEVGLRKELRKLLDEFLPTCEQLDALCVDHFPALLKRFGQGWNLISKQNLVLAEVPATALLQGLDDHLSEASVGAAQRAVILQRIDAARKLVTLEEVAAQIQRESLKEMYRLRAHRIATGAATTDLDIQIRDIKRAQRRSPQLQEGEILGERYQLLSLLGKGGFARVYQALDLWTHSLVAIKVLHSESSDEPRMLERFYRGAKNMEALHHAHIVRILEAPSQHDGFHYFVMEYLPKGDLQRAICKRQVELSLEDKRRLLLEVADAISFAHERGLIHRDVKPENILLDQNNHAYLSDFDLVQAADSTGGTRSHAALGTFLYAAPEQFIDASQATTAADVFGFGMLTAFVIYGSALPNCVPSDRSSFLHKLNAPAPIIAALERCLHNDPAQRPTLQALCNDLRLHWMPKRKEEEVSAQTILLDASGRFRVVPADVARDVVPSFRTMRPAFSFAGSADSPLPVAVTLQKTQRKTQPNLWWQDAAMVGALLGLLGLVTGAARNCAVARHDAAQTAAAQPPQAIGLAFEQKDAAVSTAPVLELPPSPALDKAVINREDPKPVVIPASPAKRGVNTPRKLPIASRFLSQPSTTKLTPAYVQQELNNAQLAFANGNFNYAIAQARAVARGNPTRAWQIIGSAACNIKDMKLAGEAFKHLDSEGRQYMLYGCKIQSIVSVGSRFKLADQQPPTPSP